MAKFSKQYQPKNRGRKKGNIGKATKEIKDAFVCLVNDNIPTLQEDLDELEAKDRLRFILDFSRYILPTLKASEVKNIGAIDSIILDIIEADEDEILKQKV